MKARNMPAALAAALALALAAGCGGEKRNGPHASGQNDVPVADMSCAEAPAGGVTIVDAWARAVPPGSAMSAAYFTICNKTADTVTLAGATAELAATVELHQTLTNSAGVSSMAPLDGIAIKAGESAALKPGGAHLMLMGLSAPIAAGEPVALAVTFSDGVALSVAAEAKSAAGAAHAHH